MSRQPSYDTDPRAIAEWEPLPADEELTPRFDGYYYTLDYSYTGNERVSSVSFIQFKPDGTYCDWGFTDPDGQVELPAPRHVDSKFAGYGSTSDESVQCAGSWNARTLSRAVYESTHTQEVIALSDDGFSTVSPNVVEDNITIRQDYRFQPVK